MNRRNRTRSRLQKEKISIIAASVFVLSALTLTGVYMSAQNESDLENEDNTIDFAKLEQQQNTDSTKDEQIADTRFVKENTSLSENNDMDVDPEYTEVNSAVVSNTKTAVKDNPADKRFTDGTENTKATDNAAVFMGEDTVKEESGNSQEAITKAQDTKPQVTTDSDDNSEFSFSDDDTLQWPIVGDVLLEYSMDKAIYFPTMQQYRYNPSIVIAANEGETITAAADGVVEKIYNDPQTGNTIVFNIGDGYELTYGQLADIPLVEGDKVKAGDIVGKVASPTIYYSQEGCNVYFKLTKDGTPADPLASLERQ